jgi:hypothetical protein
MEYTNGEILAHLKGVKQANETMLTWNLCATMHEKLQIEVNLLNELLQKFENESDSSRNIIAGIDFGGTLELLDDIDNLKRKGPIEIRPVHKEYSDEAIERARKGIFGS